MSENPKVPTAPIKYLTKDSQTFFEALDKVGKGNADVRDLSNMLRAIQNDFGLGKVTRRRK